ncbi:60S ribosomal protein L21A [Coemansia sp. RSA 2559]|nr:60S ribosomal protein L21A [Coemansia sp. RSA 2559]
MEKRVNIRVEHVRHSKCRDDFLRRVKENAALAKAAQESGKRVNLKRLPAQPREARFVSTKNNEPTTITAIPYDSKYKCWVPFVLIYHSGCFLFGINEQITFWVLFALDQ